MTDTAISAAHAPGALPAPPGPGHRGRSSWPAGRSWPRPGCWPSRSGSRTTGWRSRPRTRCWRPRAAPAPERRLRAFLIDISTGESSDVVVSLTAGAGRLPRGAGPADRRPAADHRRGLRAGRGDRPGRPGLAGGDGPARADRRQQDPGLPADGGLVRGARGGRPADGPGAGLRPGPRARPGLGAPGGRAVAPTSTWSRSGSSGWSTSSTRPVPAESGDYDDPAVRGPLRDTASSRSRSPSPRGRASPSTVTG